MTLMPVMVVMPEIPMIAIIAIVEIIACNMAALVVFDAQPIALPTTYWRSIGGSNSMA